ncbi:hypothetical protein [Lentzea sp. NPDC004782]|uniref:hypothetical protein n=1 Tax=Lentzea sp. NPDC004782 TaxID=3154458 RepID=UPI0033B55EA8
MSRTLTLTDQEKTTVRTAAYGAITLLAAAEAAGSPHRVAATGSIALASATGPIGHLLAEKTKVPNVDGKSVAEIADHVLPALTATMTLLAEQDPAAAENFRSTVLVAVDAAARTRQSEPGPTSAEMIRKITQALDAA